MSVTDPLLKELKEHAQKLVSCSQPIKDDDIFGFCECLERILYNGLSQQRTVIGLPKSQDELCWRWLEQAGNEKFGAAYSFVQTLNSVKKCRKVATFRGRIRLLIRNMLVKRCLHVPVNILVNENWSRICYQINSILGDEILCQILLSVLMLCSKLQFLLDLKNCRFLDETWVLPECQSLQLVPCTQLGLSVVFVYGMAVVVSVTPFSVAADNANIKIGDILDELNGYCITESLQGSLMNVMRKCSGQPITVYIIKAIASKSDGGLFPPLYPILKKAGLDPECIAIPSSAGRTPSNVTLPAEKAVTTYMGSIAIGDVRTDLRSMDYAIEEFVKTRCESIDLPRVVFEFHNLGLSIIREGSSEILLKHYFMEITSCSIHKSNCLAYIARESIMDRTRYKCYVFQCSSYDNATSLLKYIGRGFKQTHLTV